MQRLNPIIKWAGSKRALLPTLETYYPQDATIYLEPFAGSACLYFRIRPECAALNDINSELINLYQKISEDADYIYNRLQETENTREFYYNIRDLDIAELSCLDRAVRFIYLNRYCFNGLYRTNNRGWFNVPYGGYRSGRLPAREQFRAIAEALNFATLHSQDFETFIRENVRPKSFTYLDPPYAVRNRRVFRQYGPDTFGVDDVRRLRQMVDHICDIGGYFLLSYADDDNFNGVFSDWPKFHVQVLRNISGFAGSRKREKEVLIGNVI